MFQNSIRVIDKKHLAGYWPVDFRQLKQLQKVLPELLGSEALAKKFDLAIAFKGKPIKSDLNKSGFEFIGDRILPDIWIHGIPVPWPWLKKAGIDYKKFNVVLTPKGL